MKPILFSTPMVQAILAGRKTMTRRICRDNSDEVDYFRYVENNPTYPEKWGGKKSEPYTGWVVKYKNLPDLHLPRDCPYGKIGDILWVRETWRKYCRVDEFGYTHFDDVTIEFAADSPGAIYLVDGDGAHEYNKDGSEKFVPWRPSIHMPKEACRLFLKVTDVRVERLQDISEADAIAEGGIFTDNGICASWPQNTSKEQAKATGGLNAGWSHIGETLPDKCLRSARSSFGNLWEKINGPESWEANPWVWVITFEITQKPE